MFKNVVKIKNTLKGTVLKFKNSPISLLVLCVIYFTCLSFAIDWIYNEIYFFIINSDQVTYESLYQDLFIRPYPISGWLMIKAPSYFPDFISYFALRSLTGNYGSAWYLYLILDFGLLLLFFYSMIRLFHPSTKINDLFFTICWGTILILLLKFSPRAPGPHTFIVLGYHSGPLLNGLLVLWAWTRSLIKPLSYKQLLMLLLFCSIATASDILWIVWFGIPIGLATLALIVCKKLYWKNNIIFLVAMGTGALTGVIANRFIAMKKWFYFSHDPVGAASSTFADQIQWIQRDLIALCRSSPVLLVLLVICLGLCILAMVALWRTNNKSHSYPAPRNKDNTTSYIALHLVVIFSLIVPLLCIVFFKLWLEYNYRYIYPLIFLPWVIVGLFMSSKRSAHNKKLIILYLSPLILTVPLTWGGLPSSFGSSKRAVFWETETPYNQIIACIDAIARTHHIKFGAGEYWNAKNYTETSHAGVFINQFTYNFDILHWISNYHWYFDPANKNTPVTYDFIISAPSETSWGRSLTLFGTPSEVNTCQGLDIFIYSDEKKKRLNNIMASRVSRFKNQISESSFSDENILQDGNFDSDLANNWIYRAEPGAATFRKIQFDKEANPSGSKAKYYSRLEIKSPVSFAFLEQHFRDINALAGKDITLSFWARSLPGKIRIHSNGYLLPQGLLDNSSLPFDLAGHGKTDINDKWQKISFTFYVPDLLEIKTTNSSYALIRPLFFSDTKTPISIDITDIQLSSRGKPIDIVKTHDAYQPLAPQNLSDIVAAADDAHTKGLFNDEFKLLKRAEIAVLSKDKAINQFLETNLNENSQSISLISSNDAGDAKSIQRNHTLMVSAQANIYWRLARAHYGFSNAAGIPSNERKGNILLSADYASSAYNSLPNSETTKWWAITTMEKGEIEGVRQKNIAAAMYADLILKAIKLDPNNAELYALMGQWNYRQSLQRFTFKLQSRLLSSSIPTASLSSAKQYFTSAIRLAPSNPNYRHWLAKADSKLKGRSLSNQLLAAFR